LRSRHQLGRQVVCRVEESELAVALEASEWGAATAVELPREVAGHPASLVVDRQA